MLRLGTENDFDALYPIYMHPTVNPYLNFETMSKEEFLPLFHELITSGTLYVYENDDGQVVATGILCRLERRCSHVVCLTTFATNPNFQRKGFGTRFMRELIEELRKDKRTKRLELYVVVGNEIGLNFYKKLGFQVEGCLRKQFTMIKDGPPVDDLILAMVFD
ncbi:unnamed protein product [Rotaria magnacalcarata]|uniref:N-acetyltransferase domain-containing protein n=3 Tax=Rotaria magnacalcarata TaxID=392030 RepID=A0A816M1Q0_9BILA|nr:unnamed protein product [Rotaria magnacalcarata]CAF1961676.1 unnamed protein product [Rotaria magnacalcarata]CAF4065575.1 unnamed protein product [Rotaria magnacalcarata]CAF5178868.1 unnamed protein product [Rotaria magnacalcarata]CAF5200041.1 unnamed protein product [Rotaria magnacalcarata]